MVKSLVVPVKTFIPVVDVWKASHCISAASSMEIALKQYSFSGCQGLTRLWANVSFAVFQKPALIEREKVSIEIESDL